MSPRTDTVCFHFIKVMRVWSLYYPHFFFFFFHFFLNYMVIWKVYMYVYEYEYVFFPWLIYIKDYSPLADVQISHWLCSMFNYTYYHWRSITVFKFHCGYINPLCIKNNTISFQRVYDELTLKLLFSLEKTKDCRSFGFQKESHCLSVFKHFHPWEL